MLINRLLTKKSVIKDDSHFKSAFCVYFEKQSPEVFYKKYVLKNFAIFTGKHLLKSLLNKVVGLPSGVETYEFLENTILGFQAISGDFQHACQNAHVNTVRCAMVYVYFSFSKNL